jgi:hypothetical protein
METTQQEIKKMHPDIYTTSYEDFAKELQEFINNMMQFLNLHPSKLVDKFINKLSIGNRNERKATSQESEISDITQKQILEIVNA